MYLTYEEYQSYGGTSDEASYNDFAYNACAVVDRYTFNRLQKETEYPEAVKRCVYSIIKLLQLKEQALNADTNSSGGSGAVISSQSNDGVSVSYNVLSASELIEACGKEIQQTVNMYLSGIRNSFGMNLLYRGIYPNE